jgi:hypothetical protein
MSRLPIQAWKIPGAPGSREREIIDEPETSAAALALPGAGFLAKHQPLTSQAQARTTQSLPPK